MIGPMANIRTFARIVLLCGILTDVHVTSAFAQSNENQPDCVSETLPWLGCFFFTSKVTVETATPDFLSIDEFISLNPDLGGATAETFIPAFQILRYMEGSDAAAHNLVIHDGPTIKWNILDIPVRIALGSAECPPNGDARCGSASSVPRHIRSLVRHPYSPEKVEEIDRLNELLEINEDTIIPPFTMVRKPEVE